MSKYTPGPWTVRNGRDVYKGTRRICAANAGESLPLGESMDRAKANARLIAAAPELLEALEAIVKSADANTAAIRMHLLENARAVIAKATGDTNA